MDDPYDPWFAPEPRTVWTRIKTIYQNWLPPLAALGSLAWLICVLLLKPARPPVGMYIACLACLAVVVTIWPPESNWSKAAWLAVFFAMTGLEIAVLYQERTENQLQQAKAREKETEAFKGIGDGIKRSITEAEAGFNATIRRSDALLQKSDSIAGLAKDSVEAATGGNSYPEITIGNNHPDNGVVPLFMAIWNTKISGSFTYVIVEGHQEYCEPNSPVIDRGQAGNILPMHPLLAPTTLRPVRSIVNHYCVTMQSKNGGFTEFLGVRFSTEKQKWEYEYAILNEWNVVVATRLWL
jgi:hypothetical protein